MDRIVVVGSSGAGKSTLARRLAVRLRVPRLELDSLRHQAGWVELDDGEFRRRVATTVAGRRWVVDGNYTVVRDIVWPAADTLIWLDLSRARSFLRVVRRTIGRVLLRRRLWNGNRERLRLALSWDPERSVIRWAWVQHPVTRARYEAALVDPAHSHLRVHRLRTPRQVRAFLAGVPPGPVPPAYEVPEGSQASGSVSRP